MYSIGYIQITSLKLHKAYQTNARLVYSSRSYYTTTSNPLFSQSVRFSSLSFRSRYTMASFGFYCPKIRRPVCLLNPCNLFQLLQAVFLLFNVNLYFKQTNLKHFFNCLSVHCVKGWTTIWNQISQHVGRHKTKVLPLLFRVFHQSCHFIATSQN